MTDKEIIQALECCGNMEDGCLHYPLCDVTVPECGMRLCRESLDLINRQQAEIERLQKAKYIFANVDYCADDLEKALEKTESLKAEIRWAKETIDTLYKQIGNLKNLVTERDRKIEDLENRLKKFTTKNIVVARCGRGNGKSQTMKTIIEAGVAEMRAEAIKEFAEQVQAEIHKALKNIYEVRRDRIERIEDEMVFVCGDSFVQCCDAKIHALDGINAFIYNLVKEMVGEQE